MVVGVHCGTPDKDVQMNTVTITRAKSYPQRAHPGPAWVWLYTVSGGIWFDLTGAPRTEDASGTGIGWARTNARKRAANAGAFTVVEAWNKDEHAR